jgi:hypothetical protein
MLKTCFKRISFLNKSFVINYISISLLLAFSALSGLYAQADQNLQVSVDVKNKSLADVLEQLHQTYNLNISFNSGDSTFQTRISYKATSEPISNVLTDLLARTKHEFKNIDNQYVIYPVKTDAKSKESIAAVAVLPIASATQLSDTVYVNKFVLRTDTLIKRDTIIRYDTIIQHDTIVIEKVPEQEKVMTKIRNLRTDVFDNDARRRKGWGLGFYFLEELDELKVSGTDDPELVQALDESENWSLRCNGLSVNAFINYNRLKVETGISYTGFNSRFQFNKTILTGGIFQRDTLDAYYTIAGIDTNWVYILDSTWIPINRNESVYNNINTLHYLDLRAGFTYAFIDQRSFDVYAGARLGLHVLLGAKGSTLQHIDDIEVVDYNSIKFNTIDYSATLALGTRIKLNQAFDINPEFYYHTRFKDLYDSQTITTRIRGLGLKLGFIYYF